jgi:hypothetical protein
LQEVADDAHLQALLSRHSKNFENALSEVQREFLHASSSAEAKERLEATGDGRNLLVMGGDKECMIREHKVLRRYYEQFQQRLAIGGTRLMVIGYSFSDRHINDAIAEASQRGTLTGMFLVDPAGWDVLNPTPLHHIKVPNALEEVPRLGGSTRLFSATFAGDAFEHQKFMKFFRKP